METVRNIKTGQKQQRPTWAKDAPAYDKKDDISLGEMLPPSLAYGGRNFYCDIVLRGDEDVIYQFQTKYGDFRKLLAEVVESHFGDTANFKFDTIPEIPNAYGLLAKSVRAKPFFSAKHYTEGFLDFLDDVLDETQR